MRRAVLASLVALSAGCSLLGLDDFDLVDCSADNGLCQPLNESEGIDVSSASQVYQCAPDGFGCVLGPKDWDGDGVLSEDVPAEQGQVRDCDDTRATVRPGLDEHCDGQDNDCDGVIDEGLFVGSEEPVASLGNVLAFDFGGVAASRLDGQLDFVAVSSDSQIAARADGATLLPLASAAGEASTVLVSESLTEEGARCPRETGVVAECYPMFIASDGLAFEGRLAAAIDTLGCIEGRVRVGELRGHTLRVAGEPSVASCSGGYPMVAAASACTSVPGVDGATRLDLARMPLRSGPPQALVSWIGAHRLKRDACGAADPAHIEPSDYPELDRDLRSEVGVAVLGIWQDPAPDQHGKGGRSVGLTGADHDELPNVLGFTRGGAAPALEPVLGSAGAAHYIVAFGSDAGPSLHAVERFGAVAGQCNAPVEHVALSIRSGEPWAASQPNHVRADYLTVAAGPELQRACGTESVGTRLALAWVEGCGASDGSLWFATVDFAPATGFCQPSLPVKVRALDLSVSKLPVPLALAYQPSGVLAGKLGGGYWLANLEGDRRVRVQRFSERTGKLVDATPVVVGAADVQGLGLRALADHGLELYLVHGGGASKDARLTRARIAGACAKNVDQEE